MTSIIIKNYESATIPYVIQITEPQYHERFNNTAPHQIKLIFNNNTLIGWVRVKIPPNSLYSGFVFIYITPSYRRKGIGSYVYKEIEKTFLSIGCDWWSSYPEYEGANAFALAVGFDYTNTNHELEHNGKVSSITSEGIRQCCLSDYSEVQKLWSTEYYRMHILLGLPFRQKELTDEERQESYNDFCHNIDNYFVLEADGRIVAMGCLFSNNSGIGSLAVNHEFSGKGYGTRLASFLTNKCIQRGNPHPVLSCEGKNENALHIYQKIGYSIKRTECVALH